MAKQVQIRRGPLSNLITLVEGELGFVTDTKELVVGASGGNQFMAKKTHQHTKADIVDFAHQHTKADITDFAHDHDDRYYTETEMNTLLSGKENVGHGHTYASLSGKPTLGTISSINLPQNAAKYLKGDGSWADVPSGLANTANTANTDASFTLFSGAVTIASPNTMQVHIPTSVGFLKNAVIRIKFDAIGYTHVTEDVAVDGFGVAAYYNNSVGGPGEIVNFSITFGLTQATFASNFNAGEGQSYVLREITVMYNK